jgi:hypothetical protein
VCVWCVSNAIQRKRSRFERVSRSSYCSVLRYHQDIHTAYSCGISSYCKKGRSKARETETCGVTQGSFQLLDPRLAFFELLIELIAIHADFIIVLQHTFA